MGLGRVTRGLGFITVGVGAGSGNEGSLFRVLLQFRVKGFCSLVSEG